jgi:ribosomal protein S18 acetylase RimI-like enzyme
MSLSTDPGRETSGVGEIVVRVASPEELLEVLRVQRAGFRRVARRFGFGDDDMPPLREGIEELAALQAAGTRTFVALCDTPPFRIVGTVRAALRDDDVVEIGRLAVDDGFERRGIASALMGALEAAYPEASRFELFTGSEAADALALYDRIGYRVFRLDEFPDWTRVWLAKDREGATAPADAPLH